MRVRFKSDDAIQYEGFYFLYKSVPSGRKRDEGNRTGKITSWTPSFSHIVDARTPKSRITEAKLHWIAMNSAFFGTLIKLRLLISWCESAKVEYRTLKKQQLSFPEISIGIVQGHFPRLEVQQTHHGFLKAFRCRRTPYEVFAYDNGRNQITRISC